MERYSEEHTSGVTLEQKIEDTPCTFTISKKKQENETIHEDYCLWNAAKTSSYVWECLKKHGRLEPDPSLTLPPPKVPDKTEKDEKEKKEKQKKIYKCKPLANISKRHWKLKKAVRNLYSFLISGDSVGLSSVISLDPGGSGFTEFCLAWDMPIVKYKKDKKVHKR